MKKIDIAAALVLLGLSALVVAETWDLPYWARFTPGPAFASVWVAISGAVVGIALLAQTMATNSAECIGWPDRTGVRQVLLSITAIWLLLAMLPWLGTTIPAFIFMMFFLIAVARRPILPSLFTAVFTVGMIETVFGLWLNIDLPAGVIGF